MALNWIEPNFSNPESPFVPPLAVRTYDLHKKGRLETPIHRDTGLVDKRALIHLVKNTVIPGYDWTSETVPVPKLTRHHLLWPHGWFEKIKDLRDHGSLSARMPIIAHNWTHDVTRPAKPPTEEVAHHYEDAHEIADTMRTIARHPAFLAKETLRITQEVFVTFTDGELDILKGEIEEDKTIDLEHQYDIFSKLFEQAKEGPREFQVVDYASLELRNVTDMLRIANKIARQAMIEASIDRWLIPQEDAKIVA
jgi:hypothetical protein